MMPSRQGRVRRASVLFLVLAAGSCSSGKLEPVTIAVPPIEQNALLYIAEHKGFFADQGLRISISDFDSGLTAIRGMLSGEADIAEAAEFPFVRAVFQEKEAMIIGCNDKFENDYIVARKDRGITEILDLKGKKIGVTLGTINEFYLGRFLALNHIDLKDVALVDTRPAAFRQAIASGAVDALIAWQPHIHQIKKELNEVVVWPAQSSQAAYGVLVCSRAWVSQHGDTIRRFLAALLRAEGYLIRHPAEAKAIVRKRLNYEDSYIAGIWHQHSFMLTLDQALIIAMKDEAQWLINNELSEKKAIPNFAELIHTEGLGAIKPQAVNMIQ